VIWNQHIRDKRKALIHINTKKWNAELIGALKRGLKVYILMFTSAEMAEALHKELLMDIEVSVFPNDCQKQRKRKYLGQEH